MITNEEIEKVFEKLAEVSFVKVDGDGYHYHLTLVSDVFKNMPTVKRQQWVYSKLKSLILSGTVHALTMKTWTTEEWESQNG
jgi:acid stress-induced BolA-like protein IbaG/YrbA